MAIYQLKVTNEDASETLILDFANPTALAEARWELEAAGLSCHWEVFGTKMYRSADRAVSDALLFFR